MTALFAMLLSFGLQGGGLPSQEQTPVLDRAPEAPVDGSLGSSTSLPLKSGRLFGPA